MGFLNDDPEPETHLQLNSRINNRVDNTPNKTDKIVAFDDIF